MCSFWTVSVSFSKLVCKESQSGPSYESVQAVFDLQPFRPVVNLSSPTITNLSFTLYAVLGVVSFIENVKCFVAEWFVLTWNWIKRIKSSSVMILLLYILYFRMKKLRYLLPSCGWGWLVAHIDNSNSKISN